MSVLRYLIERPVAVFMTFVALAMGGVLSVINLPVSLMPASETPELRIEVSVPNGSPMFIEQSILNPLRTASQGLISIKDISSIAASGSGQLKLTYEYGTNMKRAYIEVNEKIDQSLQFLPRDLNRPVVKRVLQTDIPIVRLQMTSDVLSILELTQLAKNVIKRRIEQLPGVSLVEWNGAVKEVIRISPDRSAMASYNIRDQDLINSISSSNLQVAQIKLSEGLYQYDLTFENLLQDPENLGEINIFDKNGLPIRLSELAKVSRTIAKPTGTHLFQGNKGIVFAIHKRESADFKQMSKEVELIRTQMSNDYPQVSLQLTQSQSVLLNNSIQQLALSLLLGVALASIILFVFSSNWRSSLLMILLIPMAMLLCFTVLKLFDRSINIITLSGLILGVGVLIDNGIILIDNIKLKAKSLSLQEACIQGTGEIIPALVSSAATTLCVFIPLLLLQGIGGALFQQQAFTFAIVLVSSLFVSFFLLPSIYLVMKPVNDSERALFGPLLKWYSQWQKRKTERLFAVFFFVIVGAGIWIFYTIPQEPLPEVKTQDAQLSINWQRVITLDAQEEAIKNWLIDLDKLVSWECDIGNNEIFEDGIPGIEKALIYLRFDDHDSREIGLRTLEKRIASDFPGTLVKSSRAKNPYDQLLGSSKPFAVYALRTVDNKLIKPEKVRDLIGPDLHDGLGFQPQDSYEIKFDHNRINAYGIDQHTITEALKIQFGDQLITTVNLVNQSLPVVIKGSGRIDNDALGRILIPLNDSLSYPLSYFINIKESQTNRYITADAAGIFQSLEALNPTSNLDNLTRRVRSTVASQGWLMSLSGTFQEREENLKYLLFSFTLVVFLLFAILAAQFESLTKPLIILAEIPISLSGSLIFLWLFGQSLNLSSMMGIIIMLGIIVNDSILKVDSINRYMKNGFDRDRAIKQAGQDRLKPILMTTLTTILALVPVLWSTGLGSDIQIPLSIAVIGGLIIGTVCSIYLVPFLYRVFTLDGRT